ncbi:MAG: decaprenyl-phosphate phosphoribosyltransferase [Leptospiraceae bacterium]|nr:decaprenyl-phosphate phosphoribosyltransferase [Leptospiraceae bacterium]MCZ8347809.1 decaprenyl-phosphate phosphoribosyltransferase [Leptospiraceae bacterium]PJE04647.1 MAG: decaprenyl-phosphate phosphoribosyltransferase [Leptospira sp.]
MFYNYLLLMRVPQWIKNIILFAGILFGKKITDQSAFISVVFAFFLFSIIASCQYVINDYLDREEDVRHPEKKKRPIASGAIDGSIALAITLIILPLALIASYVLNHGFAFIVLFYLLFNIVYSKYLKHQVILDVMSISIGFVLRAIAGAIVIDVAFSSWLLLCTFMLSLFWGFSKRRGELDLLEGNAGKHRKILNEYSTSFLDLMMSIVATMTLMSYVMYTISPSTIQNLGTDKMIYTVPVVVYAIFRSLYIIYIKNMGHNPTKAILTDRSVIASGFLWLAIVFVVMYAKIEFNLPTEF